MDRDSQLVNFKQVERAWWELALGVYSVLGVDLGPMWHVIGTDINGHRTEVTSYFLTS